ncbi:MAG TPA: NUDIX domain-containing protein [Pirellulales bacterium]|nr:NUDIX domain-containing protein [Pirellulales bacterium]
MICRTMPTQLQPLEFGRRVPGHDYLPRPGSYAVIVDEQGRVAAVRTPHGCFLPGGGAEPGESPIETLLREVREECGRDFAHIGPLGFAIENVYAAGEGYFAKQCTFFRARFIGPAGAPSSADHELVWLSLPRDLQLLTHGSHRWAVCLALATEK